MAGLVGILIAAAVVSKSEVRCSETSCVCVCWLRPLGFPMNAENMRNGMRLQAYPTWRVLWSWLGGLCVSDVWVVCVASA